MARVERTTFKLSITVRAPFLFPGTRAGQFGLDAAALRNSKGQLLIPQDQLKGVLRNVVDDLGLTSLAALFGSGSDDAFEPDGSQFGDSGRACIFFEDLVEHPKDSEAIVQETKPSPYPRVEIDNETGAAKTGHLVMVEQPYLPGAEVTFKGQVTFFATDTEAREADLKLALGCLDQIGKLQTIGFGEVICAKLKRLEPCAVSQKRAPAERIVWAFDIDRPFLVGSDRVAQNVFKGDPVISGAALRGCIFRNLKMRGVALPDEELAKLRVGFARPVGKPRPFPLSVGVKKSDEGKKALFDQLGWKSRTQKDGSNTSWRKFTFAKDLKDDDDEFLLARFGSYEPSYEERVHTEIDRKRGTAADQKLYGAISVVPEKSGYQAVVDLTGMAEVAKAEVLSCLSEPVFGLGKTGATIRSTSFEEASEPQVNLFGKNQVAITIESPALLFEPVDGSSPEELYRSFWSDQLPSAKLIDFFAVQKPWGGYVGRRFSGSGTKYRPFWLTEPGSIFLLEIEPNQMDQIVSLCRDGVVAKMISGNPPTWEICPFIPENGFGEISADWTGV